MNKHISISNLPLPFQVLVLTVILIFGVGLSIESGYNIANVESIVNVVLTSGYFKEIGYNSIEDWRNNYVLKNAIKLFIGSILFIWPFTLLFKLHGSARS